MVTFGSALPVTGYPDDSLPLIVAVGAATVTGLTTILIGSLTYFPSVCAVAVNTSPSDSSATLIRQLPASSALNSSGAAKARVVFNPPRIRAITGAASLMVRMTEEPGSAVPLTVSSPAIAGSMSGVAVFSIGTVIGVLPLR